MTTDFSAKTAQTDLPVGNAAAAVGGSRGGPLALGFAMTVAVWTVAYVCRMPMVGAPPAATVLAMLAVVLAGGFVAGRRMSRPILGGALSGAVSGLLDILIIGSIFSDIRKSHPEYATGAAVIMWVFGSIALNAAIAALGAAVGRGTRPLVQKPANWKALFAWTLPVATFPLITAGGLVTAWGAGLAVPDWPNSFGYNMFLLPLSQMQGGTFYEHAHRLMGTLVGLTSLTLALYLTFTDRRGWVRWFAWIVFITVCLQGLLGGLRVTGTLTTSTDPAAMKPSTPLAIIHGVFAQLVFGLMAALAAACSRTWQGEKTRPVVTPSAQTDYVFSAALVALMCVQLVLGALLRHLNLYLILHITNSVFVTLLAMGCGIRAWGIYENAKPIQRSGLAVLVIVFIQILLGLAALIFRAPGNVNPTSTHALFTTLHQANGALLLAATFTLFFWTIRLARFPAPADVAPQLPAMDSI